jgi:hypothetical protein
MYALAYVCFRTRLKLINGDIVPTGYDWPIFVYAGEHFDPDDPWNGLFRGHILVLVYIHFFIPLSAGGFPPRVTPRVLDRRAILVHFLPGTCL